MSRIQETLKLLIRDTELELESLRDELDKADSNHVQDQIRLNVQVSERTVLLNTLKKFLENWEK